MEFEKDLDWQELTCPEYNQIYYSFNGSLNSPEKSNSSVPKTSPGKLLFKEENPVKSNCHNIHDVINHNIEVEVLAPFDTKTKEEKWKKENNSREIVNNNSVTNCDKITKIGECVDNRVKISGPNESCDDSYNNNPVHVDEKINIFSENNSNAEDQNMKDGKLITTKFKNVNDGSYVKYSDNNQKELRKSSTFGNCLVKNSFNTFYKKKRFKDCWTADMEQFYNEARGQEYCDVKEMQASMTSDPSKWRINPEDQFGRRVNKRGRRCFRCNELGHFGSECPRFSGLRKCNICAGIGHLYTACPNLLCSICGNKIASCMSSCGYCSNYKDIKCTLCKMIGHANENCPDLWRRYHLTTDNNPVLKQPQAKEKPPNERWCCGCAQQGHFQHECIQSAFENFPTLPHIVSYEPSYKRIQDQPQSISEPTTKQKNKKLLIAKDVLRYGNILKNLKRKCRKYDLASLEHVESLERDLKNNRFDRTKIKLMYRLRKTIRK